MFLFSPPSKKAKNWKNGKSGANRGVHNSTLHTLPRKQQILQIRRGKIRAVHRVKSTAQEHQRLKTLLQSTHTNYDCQISQPLEDPETHDYIWTSPHSMESRSHLSSPISWAHFPTPAFLCACVCVWVCVLGFLDLFFFSFSSPFFCWWVVDGDIVELCSAERKWARWWRRRRRSCWRWKWRLLKETASSRLMEKCTPIIIWILRFRILHIRLATVLSHFLFLNTNSVFGLCHRFCLYFICVLCLCLCVFWRLVGFGYLAFLLHFFWILVLGWTYHFCIIRWNKSN